MATPVAKVHRQLAALRSPYTLFKEIERLHSRYSCWLIHHSLGCCSCMIQLTWEGWTVCLNGALGTVAHNLTCAACLCGCQGQGCWSWAVAVARWLPWPRCGTAVISQPQMAAARLCACLLATCASMPGRPPVPQPLHSILLISPCFLSCMLRILTSSERFTAHCAAMQPESIRWPMSGSNCHACGWAQVQRSCMWYVAGSLYLMQHGSGAACLTWCAMLHHLEQIWGFDNDLG